MSDTNPLLQHRDLPPWSSVRAEHLVPAIEHIVADNRRAIAEILATQSELPTWDDLVLAVDEIDARLEETMGVIHTLGSVKHEGDTWSAASIACSVIVAQYNAEKMSNTALFRAYQMLAHSPTAKLFDSSRTAVLNKILGQFRRSGVELPAEKQQELTRLDLNIEALEGLFLEQLRQASAAWSKRIDDIKLLAGLSPATLDRLALDAQHAGYEGWLLRLDEATNRVVMTYAEDRNLREEYFIAYSTRASDQGPHANLFNNGPVLELLLAERHSKAQLLGFANYAELSLTDRMAESTTQVSQFLRRQLTLTAPSFKEETLELQRFALTQGIADLQPWDRAFLIEKLRQQAQDSPLKKLRAFFPLEGTLRRLCLFSERMFGIEIVEQKGFERWHETVRLFDVREHSQLIGHIYLDPYRRKELPDFAWTATRRNRRVDAEGKVTLPIAILHGNFPQPVADHPVLLAHLDLRALFHEFGHCLQHVLTRSPHYTLSGISGFGRDTAEFAGQFFELWCQSREFLLWLAAHHETGERLSEARVDAVLAAIQTHTSWPTAELLMSALLDLRLHLDQENGRKPQQVFEDVQAEFPHLNLPDYCRFATSFDYLVTGYEASVYAYKWSGVLATEAFKRFETDWVFNAQTGKDFREAVFAPADSRSLMESLEIFLERPLPTDLFPTAINTPEAIANQRYVIERGPI